ncbi:MAG: SUMF1/EgtB/PvdO family nonheme iron enzyme [Myxococcales bacterium]|nr:SUMF1/EgtB/PvdO family nonheme iron enzyme [Myxococcales bacterium]
MPTLVERYLDWLAAQPMPLELCGVDDFSLDHGELYVPLRWMRSLCDDERTRASTRDDDDDFELSELFDLLDGRRHALILGETGSGRSTALRKLTQLTLRQASRATGRPVPAAERERAELSPESLDARTLPIFLRLRTFTSDDASRTLEEFVARELADVSKGSALPLDVTVTRALWRHGKLLLLLDGLDEIVDPALRAECCRFLGRELATDRCTSLSAVVTCRFKAYEQLDAELPASFVHVALRPLSSDEARELVTQWFVAAGEARALPSSQALVCAEKLVNGLKGPRFARSLSGSPQTLTALCMLVQRGYAMPASRAEFYASCLRALLERAPKIERDAPEAATPTRAPLLTVDDAITLLRPIAHTLHASDADGDPTRREQLERDELVMRIGDGLRALGCGQLSCQDVFHWLCADLLRELAPGYFGFFHRGVQAYLAASHIATVGGDELEALAQRLGDSWWVEVLLLAVSLPRLGVFRQLMPRLLDAADLSDPTQWQTLRACVLEADFDPAPFIAQFTREERAPPGRLLAMLRMLDGVDHPALASAARELARADVTVAVRAAATRLAEMSERVDPVDRSAPYDVAVLDVDGPGPPSEGDRSVIVRSTRASQDVAGRLEATARPMLVEPITGLRMRCVPGGAFVMGSADLDDNAEPRPRVRMSAFWIGETPVTNRQYEVFLERTKGREPSFWRDRRFNDPSQPVVGVRWEDAVAFCRWLRAASGWSFDLPSEAQWEFAARGEDGRRYPWGHDEPDATRACYGQGKRGRPDVVGSYPAGVGPFGALDQAGNVWEWCKDAWDPRRYDERASARRDVVDPVAAGPHRDRHPRRGGSWLIAHDHGRTSLAAAFRSWYWSCIDSVDLGFRVVVSRAPVHP